MFAFSALDRPRLLSFFECLVTSLPPICRQQMIISLTPFGWIILVKQKHIRCFYHFSPQHCNSPGSRPPFSWKTLQSCHNEPDGVSNHRRLACLPNRLFGRRSKKTSELRVTGLCEGNSPVTGKFPTQRASNAENVSIWWRHHEKDPFVLHSQWRGCSRLQASPWPLWLYAPPGHQLLCCLYRKIKEYLFSTRKESNSVRYLNVGMWWKIAPQKL